MFGREAKRESLEVDTLIGKTARIHGDIDFTGGLQLEGRVTGNVRADGKRGSKLSVSEGGCIEGSVEVANLVLNGTVKGDIHASGLVVLGPKARVQGDLHYGVIETALGAEILGRLVPLGAAPEGAPAPDLLQSTPGA
ncbi:MAG TPA: polymer-forming cytoskeletal protein [Steroidobacteraceae bacterium]|nr:polymer-forming cytoskeletal protein [Steroidobacteraceae bacterium]